MLAGSMGKGREAAGLSFGLTSILLQARFRDWCGQALPQHLRGGHYERAYMSP